MAGTPQTPHGAWPTSPGRPHDFPTALATAQTLGWPGRGHRVLGDIHFAHGDMTAAADAYTAARAEAEQHGNTGEQAIAQAHLALTTAFTDPARAEGEIAYAEQLLAGLDQRATTLTAQVADLVRIAGRGGDDFSDRADRLRTEISSSGITAAALLLDLAVAFHHAARDENDAVQETLDRLAELTRGGDHGYYLDAVHYLADLTPAASTVRWTEAPDAVRDRWQRLLASRHQEH